MQEAAALTIAGHPRFPAVPDFAKQLKARVHGHPNIHWLGPVD